MIQEPIQPTPERAATRPHRNTTLRLAVVIGLILLLAVPVVIAMAANDRPATPQTILTAGASAAPDAAGAPKDPKSGMGDKGPGGHGPGKGPITINSISGNDLALGTEDGWRRTITVTSDTVITKAGQTITVSGLKTGDEIGFHQKRNDDGTYTITKIDVRLPHAGGEVSAVDGNSITVKKKDGSTKVITVNGSTVYKLGPTTGSKSDVTVGTNIDAAGTVSGDTFTALTVNIRLPKAGGEVTKVDGNSITVKKKDGSTRVITVNGSTVYKLGKADATKSDVTVGSDIDADGKVSGDTFTAVVVKVRPAHSGGEVTAKTSNSITVKDKDGKTTTIHVTGSTDYKVKGNDDATLSDVAVGDRIKAEGTRRSDGSLDAVAVHAGPGKPDKAPKTP